MTDEVLRAGLAWDAGAPRSLHYDDIYFSREDGLAEARAVFLQGCGLPQAWAGRRRFTVAELGFGTGLNIAALLKLWRETRPENARLSILSVEAHLLTRETAARALGCWPELEAERQALLAVWPEPRRGLHRLDLPAYAATLDLYVGEVGEALARWNGPADAWFLDGFSPAKNPAMWRDEVLAAVGRLSAPSARVASFTVAGHVRRGLAAAGFSVEKRPGYGAKRERLEARGAGEATDGPAPRVAVIGGGIAGAALVRAFGRQGVGCTLLEAETPGAGASGNPAALVTPRLDAGFGPAAELHASAFAFATAAYRADAPHAILAEGALQLAGSAEAFARLARICGWDGFAPGALRLLDGAAVAEALGEPLEEASPGALLIRDAPVVQPAGVLEAWLHGVEMVKARVERFEAGPNGWRCLDAAGRMLVEAEVVCVAAGAEAGRLLDEPGLMPVRGQAGFTHHDVGGGPAAAWGAYAAPLAGGGVLFGASHVRRDADRASRPAERDANLAMLAAHRPRLAARVRALPKEALHSRAAIRGALPDHLPAAGSLGSEGLYGLYGFGGRGFALAPLLAEHVAALALGAPSPLPADLASRLRPGRTAENLRRP